VYKSIFKCLSFLFILVSCSDLPHDNLNDPKNEDSYTSPVILIESFVNAAHPGPYNQWALSSLQSVENTFGDDVVILEYHRDITEPDTSYDDIYNTVETQQLFTNLQNKYIGTSPVIPRCVPDVFVNGSGIRISGTSSSTSLADRLSPEIDDLLQEKNYFTLEPSVVSSGQGNYQISCRIASLGNNSASDLSMRILFVKKYETDSANRAVMDMILSTPLADIDAGEYIEMDFGEKSFSAEPDAAVFLLTTADDRTIFQTAKLEL